MYQRDTRPVSEEGRFYISVSILGRWPAEERRKMQKILLWSPASRYNAMGMQAPGFFYKTVFIYRRLYKNNAETFVFQYIISFCFIYSSASFELNIERCGLTFSAVAILIGGA